MLCPDVCKRRMTAVVSQQTGKALTYSYTTWSVRGTVLLQLSQIVCAANAQLLEMWISWC